MPWTPGAERSRCRIGGGDGAPEVSRTPERAAAISGPPLQDRPMPARHAVKYFIIGAGACYTAQHYQSGFGY